MAPRFVVLRRVPRGNETVGAVIETFGTGCYEKIGAAVEMIRTTNWSYEWKMPLSLEWSMVGGLLPSMPKSSIVCFVCAFVCMCVYLLMSAYLSLREWRRLRRVYEN